MKPPPWKCTTRYGEAGLVPAYANVSTCLHMLGPTLVRWCTHASTGIVPRYRRTGTVNTEIHVVVARHRTDEGCVHSNLERLGFRI
eukprot:2525265-Rhodomonas_salina.2